MVFDRLTERLSNTFKALRSKGKLSEKDIREAMREIRLALLEADVNLDVVRSFINSVNELALSQDVLESLTPAQQIVKIVNEELIKLLGSNNVRLNFASQGPTIIMMCGLQGSGKTTHTAKLAYELKAKGKRPMMVACDVYRPAAIEQLKLAGERAGVFVFEQANQSPIEIAKNSLQYAKNNGYEVIILDTAGRLHLDQKLMTELREIKQAVKVNETLLVLDAMTGQDAVNMARAFNQEISVDGIVLSKLDGDARGGAAMSVAAVTGKPIKFVGLGEKLGDLEAFFPERMASRILGMGDLLSLIEKAETAFDEKQKQILEKKIRKDSFDLNDLLDQMKMVKKMGSLKNIVSFLPGVNVKITQEQVEQGEQELIRINSLICSMTNKERTNPAIINGSRRKRIAAGSGHKVEDVNRLLKQFDSMKQLMKQFKKTKKPRHRHK